MTIRVMLLAIVATMLASVVADARVHHRHGFRGHWRRAYAYRYGRAGATNTNGFGP